MGLRIGFCDTIAKLRLSSNPVDFWLAMQSEVPRGASPGQKDAHLLFCKTAADISSIVGHTCGVERAGKAYKEVLTSLRKAMEETRAMKAVYVYANYGLLELKQKAGDAFSAFNSEDPAAEQEQATEEKDPHAKYVLRRGNLVFKNDTAASSGDEDEEVEEGEEEDGEEGEEEGEEGAEEMAATPGCKEVRWSVPDGFKVADEPKELNKDIIESKIYMRWEKYGWQLGKITDTISSDTPRLFKKFNFRILWADGHKGPAKLAVENYGYGTHAAYNSWVILQPKD